MNRKLIVRVIGAILLIEAAAMLPALLATLVYRDGDTLALELSALITACAGAGMWFIPKTESNTHLRLREGFLIVAVGWLAMSLFGTLPYLFSGSLPRFEDALFECVSGFTTTGASVVTAFDGFPRGVMLWRVTTHWIGGMGVLVLTLALLPKLTGRTSHLVLAESPGPSLSKLVPKTGQTAKILYRIYILLTVLEFVALLLCGLSPYDAAVHTLATAGTGGFDNYSNSVAHYSTIPGFNPVPVEVVITVFMLLFGVNFAVYYKALIGDHFKAFTKDEECRWYLSIAGGFILLLTLFNLSHYHDFWISLRYSSFELASTMSTTGFVLADYTHWPVASQLLIIVAMFIGSCAGSTAGGIKVIRINMLFKSMRRSVRSAAQPKKVEVIRLDGRAVEESMLTQISLFAAMYVTLVLLGSFLMSLDGRFDVLTNITASLTCVSNVGPGFGAVGPSGNFAGYGVIGKVVGSFLMLSGRLELLPMFLLFTRAAWRRH